MTYPVSENDKNLIPKKATSKKVYTTKNNEKKSTNIFFLSLAGGALLGSALLAVSQNGKKKLLGRFIGLLVPSLLNLGLYNNAPQLTAENILTIPKQ